MVTIPNQIRTQYAVYNSTFPAVGGSGNDTTLMTEQDYQELMQEFRGTLHTHREPKTIVLICLYVPVFLLSAVGNLMVLLVVLPNKRLRNMTNCFLVNLAIADLAVTLVCVPMAVGQGVYREWVYGTFMCKMTGYMQGVSVAASVFTIMTLSADRYFAIRHPMTFKRLCTSRHSWKVVLLIWILSFGIMVPLILARHIETVDIMPSEPVEFCNEIWANHSDRKAYAVCLFVFVFVMPGCFVTSSYIMIGRRLWNEGRLFTRSESKVGREQAEKVMMVRRRVARLLVLLAILFALCWMPYHLTSLHLDFYPGAPVALQVLPFTIFLGHFNSALNPILYGFINRNFRKCIARYLKCKHLRRKKKKSKSKSKKNPVNMAVVYSPLNGSVKASVSWRRQPVARLLSNSSSRSTTGSLRFSRSSNTSFRSQQTSLQSSNRQVHQHHGEAAPLQPHLLRHKARQDNDNIKLEELHETQFDQGVHHDDLHARRHRDMFDFGLSIPTTINEESSRHSPLLSVVLERTPELPVPAETVIKTQQEPPEEDYEPDTDLNLLLTGNVDGNHMTESFENEKRLES